MKKKLLMLSIIATLLLTACSSNAGNENTKPSEAPVVATATPEPTKEVEEDEEVVDGDLVDDVLVFETSFDPNNIDPTDIESYLSYVQFGMTDAVQAYIDAGVNIDTAVDEAGNTGFAIAVVQDNVEMAQLFLDNGANINYVDEYYNTALVSAVDFDLTNMLEFLLANGADPNLGAGENQDYYPLIAAAYLGRTEAAKLLLDYEAYPNMGYWDGEEVVDASSIAEENGYTEIVEMIAAVQ